MSLKYSDYAKLNDVDAELQEAQSRRNIPESVLKRFDGKSVEDILESYANLETKLSEQGQDMGKLRRQVDQLVELQLRPANTTSKDDTAEPVEPVTVDDLYEDTEGAIAKVVDKRSKERLAVLESELTAMKQKERIAQLHQEYEGWDREVQSPEFLEWVNASRARTRLAQAADAFDFDAANDLLELWYSRKETEQKAQKKQEREKKLQDATLESASPATLQVSTPFKRHELMEKRIAAKQGDRAAERWLQANAEAIAIAYEEGNISD